nr:metallophosphoesterase [Chitinophagaceae bacterium]
QNIFKEDLQRLFALIQYFKPEQLLFVGDLFHSHQNKELELFLKWRNDMPGLQMQLIRGNHDILPKKFYKDARIDISEQALSVENFCFTHDINSHCKAANTKNVFTFSGHVHPGIRFSGMGKQALYFPCFYFTKKYAILPAFSRFTGLAKIKPKESDKVFVIVENSVVKVG